MYDNTRGGNDTLIGVDNATNSLYGDAYEMTTTPAAATTS